MIMKQRIGWLVLLSILLAAPLLGVYPVLVMKFLCFALFAAAFNLLLGYTGLLSFGHAAFFGGSSYLAAYACKEWGLTPELAVIAGMLTGALLGWLFGMLAIRRHGIYFAMITLALAQLVFFIALQAPFTGGEDGLQNVPRGKLFGLLDLSDDLNLYYVVVVIVCAAFMLLVRCVHSPFGQVLKGIRENEPRARSLGYNVESYKLQAFVISAAISGLAGALKVIVLGFASLTDVHWSTSGQVILMTLVGGMNNLLGPVVGASLVLILENKIGDIGLFLAQLTSIKWFGSLSESVTMVIGFMFMACVLFFRNGLLGTFHMLARSLKGRSRVARSVKAPPSTKDGT